MQQSQILADRNRDDHAATFRVIGPIFFYFLAAGIATVMLGPLLPSLIQHWQVSDAQAGTLFTANFIGQICGSWFTARNLRASIIYGAGLSAVGCIAMPLVSFASAHFAFFCIGTGLGAGLTAGNVIVGTMFTTARTRLIAMLNVAWGLGAIACPTLVRLTLSGGMRLFFVLTAASLAIACFLTTAIPHTLQTSKQTSPSTSSETLLKTASPLSRLTLLAFASAMFLYIGVENALGGWLPSYAIRTNPGLKAPSIALCFWLAELTGRLLMAGLNTNTGEAMVYRGSLALLVIAEIVLCTVTHLTPNAMIALTVLCGLALAPLYPLIVSFMLLRTGKHRRLGAIFSSASLGGATLPWLTGVLSTRFHGLRIGLVVPAAGACLLFSLSAVLTDKAIAYKKTETGTFTSAS